jgi:hypothetical protein
LALEHRDVVVVARQREGDLVQPDEQWHAVVLEQRGGVALAAAAGG